VVQESLRHLVVVPDEQLLILQDDFLLAPDASINWVLSTVLPSSMLMSRRITYSWQNRLASVFALE
jgi:hypothetical protein